MAQTRMLRIHQRRKHYSELVRGPNMREEGLENRGPLHYDRLHEPNLNQVPLGSEPKGRVLALLEQVPENKQYGLVAEACNHPNCLVLPFSFNLIRSAA